MQGRGRRERGGRKGASCKNGQWTLGRGGCAPRPGPRARAEVRGAGVMRPVCWWVRDPLLRWAWCWSRGAPRVWQREPLGGPRGKLVSAAGARGGEGRRGWERRRGPRRPGCGLPSLGTVSLSRPACPGGRVQNPRLDWGPRGTVHCRPLLTPAPVTDSHVRLTRPPCHPTS